MILTGVSRYELREPFLLKPKPSDEKELVSSDRAAEQIFQRILNLTVTQALELARNEPANAFSIFKELCKRKLSTSEVIEVLLARADAYFIQGTPNHLALAREDYKRVLAEIPEGQLSDDLLQKKGICLKNLAYISLLGEDMEAAEEYFEKGWEICKLDLGLLSDYIQFLQDKGDQIRALHICENSIQEHPNCAKLYYTCAKLHQLFKNWSQVHQNCLLFLKFDQGSRFKRAEILNIDAQSCVHLRLFDFVDRNLEESARLDGSLQNLIERSKIQLESDLEEAPHSIYSSYMIESHWEKGEMEKAISHSPQNSFQLFDALSRLYQDPLNLFWALVGRAAACIACKMEGANEDLQNALQLLNDHPKSFFPVLRKKMKVQQFLYSLEQNKKSQEQISSPIVEDGQQLLDENPGKALIFYDQVLKHPEKLRTKELLDALIAHACGCIESKANDRFDEVLLNLKEALTLACSMKDMEAKATIYRCYGMIELANNQLERALQQFQQGWKFGKPFRLLIDYGETLAKSGKLDRALRLCKESKLSTINELWVQGRFFEAIHEWQRARDCYKKLIDIVFGKSKALVAIKAKEVSIKLGDYFYADQYAFLAYQFDSPELLVERMVDHLNARKSKIIDLHLKELCENPQFGLSHLSSLLEIYKDELEKHPKHHVALLRRRGAVFEAINKYQEALDDFEKIWKISDANPGLFSKKELASNAEKIVMHRELVKTSRG